MEHMVDLTCGLSHKRIDSSETHLKLFFLLVLFVFENCNIKYMGK